MLRLTGALLSGSLLLSSSFASAQDTFALDTPEKRFSYAIGQNVGNGIKGDLGGSGFDLEAFSAALQDVFNGDGGRLSDEEMQAAFGELQAIQQAAAEQAAQGDIAEGLAFLEAKGAEDGISSTENGVLYKVTTMGDGAKPTASDTVTVHYSGRLLDGTEFDSSIARGQPAQFPVGGVIPGWTEVLQEMPTGSTWEVWIPQHLAYGARGAGGDIPPYAILNFTIELIAIAGQ